MLIAKPCGDVRQQQRVQFRENGSTTWALTSLWADPWCIDGRVVVPLSDEPFPDLLIRMDRRVADAGPGCREATEALNAEVWLMRPHAGHTTTFHRG